MERLPGPLRRRKKLLLWCSGSLLAYTIFGFVILPWIVKWVAVSQLSKQLDRETSIRQVRINPFVLSGTIRGLLIKDKDGEPFISVDEAYANFQLSSFFGKPWVFKDVWTVRPYCRVQINKDYSLNFSDLATKFSQPSVKPKPKSKKPLLLHVSRLQVKGASVSFTDLTPTEPFQRLIGPVEITISDLRTDPNKKNPYSFAGTTDSGEKFSWNGDFSLDPLQSEGEVGLEGLSVPKYAALFQDLFKFEINDCTVGGSAAYRVSVTGSNFVASVTNATFHLKNFKISEKAHTNNVAELDDLQVSRFSADTSRRTAEIGAVSVGGARIFAERSADEKINLLQLTEPASEKTNAPGGILFLMQTFTNAYAALLQTTNLWTATLQDLQVTNCLLGWEDQAAPHPVSLRVDGLAVAAKNLSNVPGPKQTVAVSFHWNTNGSVLVESALSLSPLGAETSLQVHDVELGALSPYLQNYLNAFLLGSKVGVQGKLFMRADTNGLPEVTFHGDANMDDFAAVDAARNDLLKWKSVQLHDLDAALQPPAISIRQMDIVEPNIRVAFDTNQNLNFMAVLKTGTNLDAALQKVAAPESSTSASTSGSMSLSRRLGAILERALASQTNALGAAGSPKIAVETIAITNGVVQFNDRSVQPPVQTTLERISGTVKGVSSDELKRADILLSATAARTGPIEIIGKINPLSKTAPTEMQVTFRDVDLTPGSPYSGKFLGYRLNRGKLGLKVDYQVAQRKLKAKNVLTLDNFTLGEKVQSTNATKLPVKLAVAILKDRNGRIELDVPIEGNLDDPTFHFGKVIVHVLGNIVTKLATAPFAALGSLFGGKGEEASYQDFSAGSAELAPSNVEKLQAFVNGLYERPALEVEIQGTFDPVKDRDALRKKHFEQNMRQARWAKLGKRDQAKTKPEDLPVTDKDYRAAIEKAWAKLKKASATNMVSAIGATNQITENVSSVSEEQRGASVLILKEKPTRKLIFTDKEQQVLETISVKESELLELAKLRAQNVRDEILKTGKVESARLSLADPAASPNGTSRVNFQLQ